MATIKYLVAKSFRQRKYNNEPVEPVSETPEEKLAKWESIKLASTKKTLIRLSLESRKSYIRTERPEISSVLQKYPFLKTLEGIHEEQKALMSKPNLKFINARIDRLLKKVPRKLLKILFL